MATTSLYRALLWLYPPDFRQEFSAEMISVFEQRAGERFANREAVSVVFTLTELGSIVKGACVMWFSKVLPFSQRGSTVDATTSSVMSTEEVTKLRSVAIQKMVAAIAEHDFPTARRYSEEEERLKQILHDLETPAASRRLA